MPISQRLKTLDIDIFHKLDLDTNFNQKGESYFADKIQEAYANSFSSDFTEFYKKIYTKTDNLPSILHHRDEIIKLLLEHIKMPENESLALFLE